MLSKIRQALFGALLYSRKTAELEEHIEQQAKTEYAALLDAGQNTLSAMGAVLQRFSTLEDAAAAAGVEQQTLRTVQAQTATHDAKAFRRAFRAVQALSAVAAVLLYFMLDAILLTAVRAAPLWFPVFSVATAVPLYFILAKYRRRCAAVSYDILCLPRNVKSKLDIYTDRLKKRHINYTFLSVGLVVFFSMSFEIALVSQMSRPELLGLLLADRVALGVGAVLFGYSFLMARYILSAAPEAERREYGRYCRTVYLCCGGFLALSFGLTALLQRFLFNPFPILYLLTALFLMAAVIINYRKRARLMLRNLRINRVRIACFALAAAVMLTVAGMKQANYALNPYVATVPRLAHEQQDIRYDEDTGVYTIVTDDEDFRILHLTDIHLGGSAQSAFKDYLALEACKKLMIAAQPDLVIVTGDLVFPMGVMSFSLNNEAPVREFAAFMRNAGIPWAFTFGNHDTESMATTSAADVVKLYESLSFKASGTLLFPYTQPDVYGKSNQLIRIENTDGTLRRALFLLDSNDYVGGMINVYDYIHDDQVDWYAAQVEAMNAEAGRTVPSSVFFHIPLQEYRTANDLYEAGSDEVTWYFGEIGETAIDTICCSDYPSRLFDTAHALGSTDSMFCGHDHYNNISLEYRGIRLTYGMSIDYLVMPGIAQHTRQRGGELLTVRSDGSFALEQLRLTDLA